MDALLKQAVEGMRKNGFEVVEVRTAAEACDYLLGRITAGASVGVGGSVSVRDTGVLTALAQKGCKVYTSWGAKPEDVPMIRENSRRADVYLSSANAVTRTGKLVLVDGIGNRVGAVCDSRGRLFRRQPLQGGGRRNQHRRGAHQKNLVSAKYAQAWHRHALRPHGQLRGRRMPGQHLPPALAVDPGAQKPAHDGGGVCGGSHQVTEKKRKARRGNSTAGLHDAL